MSEIYLKRLEELASIDITPVTIKAIEKELKDRPECNHFIAQLKEVMNGDGTNAPQDFEDIYFTLKYCSFFSRFFYIMGEIDAYYKIRTLYDFIAAITIPKEDQVGINGIFDILKTLPDYYYNFLIKSIDNSEYYQEDLIECIVQDNKKEFVEIIRREKYDITALSNFCYLRKRVIDDIEMVRSEEVLNITEEDSKKIEIKNLDYIQTTLGDEVAEVFRNDKYGFIQQMTDGLIHLYWQEKNRYTTAETNIVEGLIDEIRNSPQYIELYEQYHKDGVFYPEGVEDETEDVETEDITDSLLEQTTSTPEPIELYDDYEGEEPLYCNHKNKKDARLKIDTYFSDNYNRLMDLLKKLAEDGYISAREVNSYYTHFTGLGGTCKISKKLHWRGHIKDLCFIIYMLYPYRDDDKVRYEPITQYIEYKHEASSYKNGTDLSSAASRPTLELKDTLLELYLKSETKPERYSKL